MKSVSFLNPIWEQYQQSGLTGKIRLLKYLALNNISYYFINSYEVKDNEITRIIRNNHKNLKNRFNNSLKLLKSAHSLNKPLILFKSVKDYDEIQDGDIDILTEPDYLEKILLFLKIKGYYCRQESVCKFACIKKDYPKLEPRCSVEIFKGIEINFNQIRTSKYVSICRYPDIYRTASEFDSAYMILNSFFGPRYMRIYDYMQYIDNRDKIINVIIELFPSQIVQIFYKLDKYLANIPGDAIFKFPVYLPFSVFLQGYLKYFIRNSGIPLYQVLKHPTYFIYMKLFQFVTGRPIYYHFQNNIDNNHII